MESRNKEKVGAIPSQPENDSVSGEEKTESTQKILSVNNRELFTFLRTENPKVSFKKLTEQELASLVQVAFLKKCNYLEELDDTDETELNKILLKWAKKVLCDLRGKDEKVFLNHSKHWFKKSTDFQFHESKLSDIKNDIAESIPECHCKNGQENGPFYTHLGHARSIYDIRANFANRFNKDQPDKSKHIHYDKDIRIVEAFYRNKAQLNDTDCPAVQCLIKPSDEKLLIVVKKRPKHCCQYTYIVVQVIFLNGIEEGFGQRFYNLVSDLLGTYGEHKVRPRTERSGHPNCPAQGDPTTGGGSFTFFCTKTPVAGNKCKWFNSYFENIRNVKLSRNKEAEDTLEEIIVEMAKATLDTFEKAVPTAFHNMDAFTDVGNLCRIPTGPKQPFAGCTCVSDYTAHPHTDFLNLKSGCTVLVSLGRPDGQPQYHVLPHYYAKPSANVEVKDCSGGLGLALPNLSILFEPAKRELHATTHVQNPSRKNPNRLAIVFFQHRGLTEPYHQSEKVEKKLKGN